MNIHRTWHWPQTESRHTWFSWSYCKRTPTCLFCFQVYGTLPWNFVFCTTPGISEHLNNLEYCVKENIIPAIMGKFLVSDKIGEMIPLPAKMGSLGIPNCQTIAGMEYANNFKNGVCKLFRCYKTAHRSSVPTKHNFSSQWWGTISYNGRSRETKGGLLQGRRWDHYVELARKHPKTNGTHKQKRSIHMAIYSPAELFEILPLKTSLSMFQSSNNETINCIVIV